MKKIFLLLLLGLSTHSLFAQEESPFLQKYREMALKYNQELKAAEKNILASMEYEKMARADLKPKLKGNITAQYTGNPMELNIDIPALGGATTFQGNHEKYGASVSLLQPIFTGGRLLHSIRLAQQQQSLATNQLESVRSAICYHTDIQYWNTVARFEMIHIAREFRNSIASLTTTIKERVDVGLVDPQDLLMAEVKLNEAEYNLLQAQNNFEIGRMALNSMIGIPLDTQTEIDAKIPNVNAHDSLFKAKGNVRPEVKMAEDRIRMANSSLKLNDSKYKPQLLIGADGNYSSPGYNFDSDLDPNYAVYATLSVPIFEWGKRRSEKRASRYSIGVAGDNLNKVEDKVTLELQTARLALLQAMSRVDLALSSLEKARENERKAIERYSEGSISILEVIDAQTYRQTSQINYTQAKVAAQGNYSELIKALNYYNFE